MSAIEKAGIVLDILLKHDEKNSDVGLRQVLDEIILAWKELE